MADSLENPVDQAHQLIADARRDFASDVDALLTEFRGFSRLVEETFDLRTREEAWRTLRRFVLEKFDQRLPRRRPGDRVLLQLVREAFDAFNDPESKIDLRDWTKEARKVLQAERSESES